MAEGGKIAGILPLIHLPPLSFAAGNWHWHNPCGENTSFSDIDLWLSGHPVSADMIAQSDPMHVTQCKNGLKAVAVDAQAHFVCRIGENTG